MTIHVATEAPRQAFDLGGDLGADLGGPSPAGQAPGGRGEWDLCGGLPPSEPTEDCGTRGLSGCLARSSRTGTRGRSGRVGPDVEKPAGTVVHERVAQHGKRIVRPLPDGGLNAEVLGAVRPTPRNRSGYFSGHERLLSMKGPTEYTFYTPLHQPPNSRSLSLSDMLTK
jgi:hypothetical protein